MAACGSGTAEGPSSPVDAGPDTTVDTSDANAPDAADANVTRLPVGPVDRAGRALVNAMVNFGDDVKEDAWNAAPTFQDWSQVASFDSNIAKNLALADALDGKNDWSDDAGVDSLASAIKLDVLLVDTSIACTALNGYCEAGYLDIENEIWLGGPPHKTCGGRTLPDDAIDKTLSLVVTKKLTGVSDGVDAPTKPATRTFPYLADPN
jgi:hypothetical protein